MDVIQLTLPFVKMCIFFGDFDVKLPDCCKSVPDVHIAYDFARLKIFETNRSRVFNFDGISCFFHPHLFLKKYSDYNKTTKFNARLFICDFKYSNRKFTFHH